MKYLIWISSGLYLVSLTLPGFILKYDWDVSFNDNIWYGYNILAMGGLGIFVGQYAWYANPLFFLALLFIFFKLYRAATITSLLCFLVGINAIFFEKFPKNEGSSTDNYIIDHLGLGYYVWELSFVFLGVYCYSKYKNSKVVFRTKTK